jgi:hypothetical protein
MLLEAQKWLPGRTKASIATKCAQLRKEGKA